LNDISILLLYIPLDLVVKMIITLERTVERVVVVSHFDVDDDKLTWLNAWLKSYCAVAVKVDKLESGWTDDIDGMVSLTLNC
jgi:hypothetical protein